MISKKHLAITALLSLLITSMLFMIIPIAGQEQPEYDPWLDINDDGYIGIDDINTLAHHFAAEGTAINKTGLLLELMARVDSLNSSLLEMESVVNGLNTALGFLTERVSELEANCSMPPTLIHNVTYTTVTDATTETLNWIDMDYTSAKIQLNVTSNLFVMFSTEAQESEANQIIVRCLVDETAAQPGVVYINADVQNEGFTGLPIHAHRMGRGAYSYCFYSPLLSAGTYTIKIQWQVDGGTGYVYKRTLSVIALPVP